MVDKEQEIYITDPADGESQMYIRTAKEVTILMMLNVEDVI
jgi:hypothetical protein